MPALSPTPPQFLDMLRSEFSYRAFRLNHREVTFSVRGFSDGDQAKQKRFEEIGLHFLHGYEAALRTSDTGALAESAALGERANGGFIFEGAGMGVALREALWLLPSGSVANLVERASHHAYLIHVGAGWALARLPTWRGRAIFNRLDPLLRYLAVDGLGFHDGYFFPNRPAAETTAPAWLPQSPYDHGQGRSLWFRKCGSVRKVAAAIGEFPQTRRGDLWSGVGLAAAYAGALRSDECAELASAAQGYRSHLAQGVAFAAEARDSAGNPSKATEQLCGEVWGLPSDEVARIARHHRPDQSPTSDPSTYHAWRRAIMEAHSSEIVLQAPYAERANAYR